MGKLINLITTNHESTNRNYLERMINQKVKCMKEAKKYSYNYWDGSRKFGYGGYKYIPNRWTKIARKIIKRYKLKSNSNVLDAGCGKAFLLYEIKKILPEIKISGFDISKYGIKNAKKEIKKFLYVYDVSKKLPYKNKNFDLVISINCLHNLQQSQLGRTINELSRVSKNQYICVESFRNEQELFNLQCWALTCQTFFSKKDWEYFLKKNKYKGDYELIYFK